MEKEVKMNGVVGDGNERREIQEDNEILALFQHMVNAHVLLCENAAGMYILLGGGSYHDFKMKVERWYHQKYGTKVSQAIGQRCDTGVICGSFWIKVSTFRRRG